MNFDSSRRVNLQQQRRLNVRILKLRVAHRLAVHHDFAQRSRLVDALQ